MTRLAAISPVGHTCLAVLGRAIDKTPLRRFAGGMIVRYEIVRPGGAAGEATR